MDNESKLLQNLQTTWNKKKYQVKKKELKKNTWFDCVKIECVTWIETLIYIVCSNTYFFPLYGNNICAYTC